MRPPRRSGAALLAVGLGVALVQAVPGGPGADPGFAPVVSSRAGTPRCEGRPATILGSNGPDRIQGTRGDDVIVARKGADRVDGGRGDDIICGGPGNDVLLGGGGDDRLHGGLDQRRLGPGGSYLVGDLLLGGPGRDLLDGGDDGRRVDQRRRPDTYSWSDANRRVRVDLGGPDHTGWARGRGRDTVVVGAASGIIGSPRGDRLTGSDGDDRVQAGGGSDRVTTGPGDDRVFPDPARGRTDRDVVVTGRGRDLVSSRGGRDEIATGGGADFVEAFGAQPTQVRLGGGADYLGQYLAPGAGTHLDGGGGDDVVTFYGRMLAARQPGSRFTVDYRHDTLRSAGRVMTGTVTGFEGHRFVGDLEWSFFGSGGDDRVWAIEGGPLLARGYAGDDSFTGTPRNDLLAGGKGSDYAEGGGGSDRCRSIERGAC